jgi:hypothetical protein
VLAATQACGVTLKLHTIEPQVAPQSVSFTHAAFATPLQPSKPTTLTANDRAIALHFNFMVISLIWEKVLSDAHPNTGSHTSSQLAVKKTHETGSIHRSRLEDHSQSDPDISWLRSGNTELVRGR